MRDIFSDIFWMESLLPFRKRQKVRVSLDMLFSGALAALFALYLFDFLIPLSPFAPAIVLVVFCVWALARLLEGYLVSREKEISLSHLFAGVLAYRAGTDAVLGFVESEVGIKILALAKVPLSSVEAFKEQKARSKELAPRVLSLAASRDLKARLTEMYREDSRFSSFLAVQGVSLENLLEAAELFLKTEREARTKPLFASYQGAFYLQGVGKRWSVGNAPTIHAYAKEFPKMAFPHADELAPLLPKLEAQYVRNRVAKVALRGEGQRVRELLLLFAERLKKADCHAFLAERYPVLLDTNKIVGRARDKVALEETLAQVVNEAIRSGIFFLIIEDWDLFVKSCASFGVEARHIFDPLFTSSRVSLLISGYTGSDILIFDAAPSAALSPFQETSRLLASVT